MFRGAGGKGHEHGPLAISVEGGLGGGCRRRLCRNVADIIGHCRAALQEGCAGAGARLPRCATLHARMHCACCRIIHTCLGKQTHRMILAVWCST